MPVVPSRDPVVHLVEPELVKRLVADHLSQIPQFERLILAVRDAVPPIALRSQKADPFCMPHERPTRSFARKRAAVPNFNERIVGAGKEEVGRGSVGKGYRIHVVLVSVDAEDRAVAFDVCNRMRSSTRPRSGWDLPYTKI